MWTLSSVNLKSSLLDDGLWLCADILVPGCALVRAGPAGLVCQDVSTQITLAMRGDTVTHY